MYLQSLKMTGFKSFAQPVVLTFDPHITAIIGPNGSGKSNIIDAVRWILGEQNSRSLRGNHMEDIIFSGTDYHKAMGYSEVVATLNNEDHYLKDYPDNVSVSRRLFRTGESAYYINNHQVRLKDVHTLFADTGLGKNGYSIVSQGSVENIVKSDPYHLRNIIEEAVGIVNYRTREHEAEKELDAAQNNMDRVKDILNELDRQRQPLLKQSEKARRYLELKEQLKERDLYKYTQDIKSLREKEDKNQKAVETCNKEIESVKIKIHDADARYQRLRNQKRALASIRHQSNQDDKNFSLQSADIEKNKIRIEEKIKTQKIESNRLQQSVLENINKQDNLTENIKKVNDFIQEIQQQNKRLTAKQLPWQNKINDNAQKINKLQEELAFSRNEREKIRSFEEKEKNQKNEYISNLAALDEKIKIRQQSIADYLANQEKISQKISNEKIIINEQQQKLIAQKNNFTQEKNKLVEVTNEAQKISHKLEQYGHQLKKIEPKIELLKSEQYKFINYAPAIKWMMNKKNSMPKSIKENIIGTVEELIEIPDRLVLSITLALGRKSQNIIVRDTETARYCIRLLKKNKIGRVTFLPLDNVSTVNLYQKEKAILNQYKGFVGIASDLVKFPEIIRPAVQNLLGRVIVAQDFSSAQEIRRFRKKYTIVTIDGEMFYPGGAITGGANKNNRAQAQLNNTKTIERLQEKQKQIMEIMSVQQRVYYQNKTRIKKQQKVIRTLISQQQYYEKELYKHTHSLESLNTISLNFKDQILKARQECEALTIKRRETDAWIQKSSDKIKKRHTIQDSETIQEKINTLFKEQRENDQFISKYQVQIEKNKETIKQKSIELQNLTQEKANVFLQVKERKADFEKCGQTIKQLQQQLLEIDQTLQRNRQDLIERNEKAEQYETQENHIESELENIEKEIRILNHQQILQNDALNKLTLAANRIATVKKNIQDKMQTRYGMNDTMIADWTKSHKLKNTTDLEIAIRSLERQINELGAVNVNAIENFETINRRYCFIQKQYEDLLKSKEKVNQIIAELQTSMAEKFDKEFRQLQVYFSEIFKTLFEGGQAKLFYIDPQNVLHSGIGLEVQPPGKNVKQLSLLSGGEKALTAICLLFAFIKLNPSPFCIVDEVDAALDEQNIYRFTEYLKKLSYQSQFIVVTHRKNTLKICDSIYGVSMSNTGISKIVSVKVSDYL